MQKSDLDKIKGTFYIYTNGEYVVLTGTNLYILKTDGSLVACRKDLKYADRITFLSGSRMLLCSSKSVFHMISLSDGSDIWTAPYTKTNFNLAKLAVSPDEAFAYTYDEWKNSRFISRLNLHTHEVDFHDMYMDAGATRDIICDEEGIPCLLKSLAETIGGKLFLQNGVRIHDFSISPGNTTCWKTKWSFEGNRSCTHFYGNADKLLTDDFHVYTPATGISENLLENESVWQDPKDYISDCWLDSSKKYLCIMCHSITVIIDIHARKVVAQYATKRVRGCLIGNEFWICVDRRICRKPFPAFEEAPPEKLVGGMDWFYSKHPELW